jgi:hypothetical protein
MAKGTIITIFILSIFATLLLGINIGKRIGNPQTVISNQNPAISGQQSPLRQGYEGQAVISLIPITTHLISPTSTLPISKIPTIKMQQKISKLSAYSDKKCGFSIAFPSSYISSKTENDKSVIFADQEDPKKMIAFVCDTSIPRPPVTSENIEAISLDGQPATLYHDKNSDGSERDEVIVRNKNNGLEIIIAGFGEIFQQALSSFKFL